MRKGHGSSKVPGVKLRPAAPAKRRAPSPGSKWANEDPHDQPPEEDELNLATSSKRPFAGFIICFTGVQEKASLYAQAKELGATKVGDFTEDVTHLIAQATGSPKYLCALERRIPIMEPAWITRTHARWAKGEDIDLVKAEGQYRLPPFLGMNIAITGEDVVSRRTELGKMIRANGGRYFKQLDDTVTHLIVCSPPSRDDEDPTDKVVAAQAMNERSQARGEVDSLIHIVWEEWLWDCVDWNGKWDEQSYTIERPRPKRREDPNEKSLAFEAPSFAGVTTSTQHRAGPSRLDQDEEMKVVRRSGDIKGVVQDKLWSEILSFTNPSVKGKEKERPPADDTEDEAEAGPRILANATETEKSSTSVLSRVITRTASFVPSKQPTMEESKRSYLPDTAESAAAKLFGGRRVRTLGQASQPAAVNSLQYYGALVIKSSKTDNLADADYILVRLQEAADLISPDHPAFHKVRTECWLEMCTYEERICKPEEHVSYTPLRIPLPVPGAENVHIFWSGLDNGAMAGLQRVSLALGFNIPKNFSRTCTHLICPSREGKKYERALEWNIPVEDPEWVYDVARTGVIPGMTVKSASAETSEKQPISDVTNNELSKKKEKQDARKASDNLDPEKSLPTPAPSSSRPASVAEDGPAKLRPPLNGRGSTGTSAAPSPISPSRQLSSSSFMSNSTGGLSSSIAALLGKRAAEKEEPEPAAAPSKKKARPPTRAKTVADRSSASASPARPVAASVPLPDRIDLYPETALNEFVAGLAPGSQQVEYQDPAQIAQKRKLLALLEQGQDESTDEPAAPVTKGRKSIPRKSKAAKKR